MAKNRNRNSFGRAKSIVGKKCQDRDYTRSELHALARHVRHFYLDSENYPNVFNLRIARKFETPELDQYYEQAGSYPKKTLYESTVFTRDGEFYFGFHHDIPR